MRIHCIGLNHNTATLHLREQMAFNDQKASVSLARLGCGNLKIGSLNEFVILSTCNRVEIYAVGPVLDFPVLEQFLSDVHGLDRESFTPHLYRLADEAAIQHLLEVAAGLDSLVVGEPQILGQVTQAYALARSQDLAGKVLSHLFESAIRAGKRARTETAIAQNPASIASVAVRLASQSVPDLASARVVLVGAGEMAENALQALRKRGVDRVMVINRTLERAQELAQRWNGEAATFEKLPEAIHWADILISSTSAPHTLIHPQPVTEAMVDRVNRPLVMIDIAVPRDVDEQVGSIANVQLYDMDALQEHLDLSLEQRRREVPQVQWIIQEELTSFLAYLETLDVLPIIAEIRQKAELIRQHELEKTLRRLPNLSSQDRHSLEAMTLAMVKKILHEPILRLRSEAAGPEIVEFTTITRALFGLTHNVENQLWAENALDSNPTQPV
jgi:glutamyl-tRNA reductase